MAQIFLENKQNALIILKRNFKLLNIDILKVKMKIVEANKDFYQERLLSFKRCAAYLRIRIKLLTNILTILNTLKEKVNLLNKIKQLFKSLKILIHY